MMADSPPPLNSIWFLCVIGAFFGAIFGSFATMLTYRLPRGMSIVSPRSHCVSCHTPLGPRDLVPIFSWLVFKGHCRHCGAKIGVQYLYIELAATLIGGLVALFIGY